MKYFGTDGIRKPADDFTPQLLTSIIRGLINYKGDNIKIFIAGDTRESSEWIIDDLAKACETYGIEYSTAGVLPTPAINYCFYEMGFDFAIDVTASHNPYTDNGIKIFERGTNYGQKLSKIGRKDIELSIDQSTNLELLPLTDRTDLHAEAIILYLEHLQSYIGTADFIGLNIAIDCANGATSAVGKTIFERLGANVHLISSDSSYGQGINNNCGSTHLDNLKTTVIKNHLDFGIAYDGDGDRCLLVDETGAEIDGDHIVAILANYLHLDKIAVTVMANQGLLNWATKNHISAKITPVGDSNVAEAMRQNNIQLGGEQSGHIILPNEPTGDGILTSLMLAKVVSETKTSLQTLASIITKLPEITINLPATSTQKTTLKTSEATKSLLLEYSKKASAFNGRILVRPSGTENLIRITVWGNDEPTITSLANELSTKLEQIL